MMKKTIDTIILDLDNTLFDWFAVWYASFEPVYNEMLRVSGNSTEDVEASIRRVHQERRTSEYTFLIEEADALAQTRDSGDIRSTFSSAIEEARVNRDRTLKLYPTVFRTLWDLKKRGTRIIAYTESMAFYSAYRLKRFGLDGVIDILFSPKDHDMPAGMSIDRMRRLPDEFYELQVTEVRHTPPGELKPNPRVLLDIINAVGATPDKCAYVGDSLYKDVAMARDVGVYDVHAKYGESQRKPEYNLLRRVSHWTEEDVQREKAIIESGHDFKPSAVLNECFAEIYMFCDFVAANETNKSTEDNDKIKNSIEVWKKTVDVQQHFNDLGMRIRNFAITIVGVLIAAVGFTYQHGLETSLFGFRYGTGLFLVAAAGFAWLAFFLMDRYWYHVLLKGSVTHAGKIETELNEKVPGIGLGKTISEVSGTVRVLGFTMRSERRLNTFYILGFLMLAVVFVALMFATPNKQNAASPPTASIPPATEQPKK